LSGAPRVGNLFENGVGHIREKGVGRLLENSGLIVGHFPENSHSSDYDYLIGNLKDITTPPFPSYGGGLDGITFEVKIENGLNKAHFSWWVECPERWKELEYLANRLITYARSTHNS